MPLLEGKRCLVAGAGSGIGRAVAACCVRNGGQVVLADRSGRQDVVADELGPSALAASVDMTSPESVSRLVDCTVDRLSGLDVLINCVGACDVFARIDDLDPDAFDRILRINLRSAFLGMKYAIPPMIDGGGGAVVNFSSAGAFAASAQIGAYGAAKAGIVLLTKTAAIEYGLQKVRVNAVCPGPTRTPMLGGALEEGSSALAALEASMALGRVAEPDEVANVAVFLSSDLASAVTGIAMPVDCGRLASAESRQLDAR